MSFINVYLRLPVIPCFCPFLDFLRVPLAPAFSVGHRFLRRGREADGVSLRATGVQAVRPRDTDPTRTHVPWDPPHVVHSTASDGWGGGVVQGTGGFIESMHLEYYKDSRESRNSVCLNIVSAWSKQNSWFHFFMLKKHKWLDLLMGDLIVPTEPCPTTSMLTF